jgi:PAS domain S-box-containing protein
MHSRDVSDRKALEEQRAQSHSQLEDEVVRQSGALQESESRFRALADQVPDLIAEFDESGCYIFANQSFGELLGIDPAEITGTSPAGLIHPEDLAASRAGMTKALIKEHATRSIHRLRHADGSWRWFDNTGRAYRAASGALRFVSIGRDITQEREFEAERRRHRERMEGLQRLESLGVMAGGIAHDFNNLLAVILGNLSLLEEEPEDNRDRRMKRIRTAAEHAEALTDPMLTYAGRSISDFRPLDLSQLVVDTRDLLSASATSKCQLLLDLSEEATVIHGDETQLRQVLLNLVTNAAEAFGEAGGTLHVRTARRWMSAPELLEGLGAGEPREGNWILLEVSDDGPGMEDAVRRRIFEPFYTTKASGRGLGLAAVLGIASAHNGVLKLDSAPGQGTTF